MAQQAKTFANLPQIDTPPLLPWQKKNIPVHPCSYFLLILHMILFLLSHTCSTLKAEWWEEGERGTSEFSFQTSPSSIDRRKGEVCQLSGASLLSPSVTSPYFILPLSLHLPVYSPQSIGVCLWLQGNMCVSSNTYSSPHPYTRF